MTTFVLVHGSWHGGWCWRYVAPILRSAGNEVYTPTLSGLGERSHLIGCGIDLGTHIQDVVNLLEFEDLSEVALVGHSYAGMVISGVAAKAPKRLARLIYLDAYVPNAGQSELDFWPPGERMAVEREIATGKFIQPPPPPSVFGITDPRMARWVSARLTPHPLLTYDQPIPAGDKAMAALPRAYILCTDSFAHFAARARRDGWRVRELRTGHDAMLTEPRKLSELLQELSH